MKITLYGLIGLIKENKAPKKIMYKNKLWEYENQTKDYFTNHYDDTEWLFDEYVITDILNDEVEILEDYLGYIYQSYSNKIEKLDLTEVEGKIYGSYATYIDIAMGNKINEIIEVLNEKQ